MLFDKLSRHKGWNYFCYTVKRRLAYCHSANHRDANCCNCLLNSAMTAKRRLPKCCSTNRRGASGWYYLLVGRQAGNIANSWAKGNWDENNLAKSKLLLACLLCCVGAVINCETPAPDTWTERPPKSRFENRTGWPDLKKTFTSRRKCWQLVLGWALYP